MNTSINKTLSALVLVLGGALAAASASAEVGETRVIERGLTAPSVSVSIADLNLATADGQDALHRRLSVAAREVCGASDLRSAGSLRAAASQRACQEAAMADAMGQVHAGQVASTAR